ncbi:hypothetical protein BDW74DRAFT_149760 [Aspergillus multicolor]|uniref:uncharacterized protein n=1 Tax=Aspergillus multicolor TaxID=41759 RepID=UPI003CCE2093
MTYCLWFLLSHPSLRELLEVVLTASPLLCHQVGLTVTVGPTRCCSRQTDLLLNDLDNGGADLILTLTQLAAVPNGV